MANSVLAEFIEKLFRIENERKLLLVDKKDLVDNYREKLDVKAVAAAVRIVKIKSRLDASDAELENMVTILEKTLAE
jgi:uncharacterized protein (UPF0335 family)